MLEMVKNGRMPRWRTTRHGRHMPRGFSGVVGSFCSRGKVAEVVQAERLLGEGGLIDIK